MKVYISSVKLYLWLTRGRDTTRCSWSAIDGNDSQSSEDILAFTAGHFDGVDVVDDAVKETEGWRGTEPSLSDLV